MPSPAHDWIASTLSKSTLFKSSDLRNDVLRLRAQLEAFTVRSVLPEGTRSEPFDAGCVRAEWLAGPGADADRVLLYLHGGGYIIGSIATHRALAARIAAAAGVRALILEYGLAPERPFPQGLHDAVAAYDSLLSSGVDPRRIALGGDSAGGGLAVSTLLALRDSGRPLPGAVVLLSPWIDLTGSGASMLAPGADAVIGTRDEMLAVAALYLNGADPRTPETSPLHADLSGLPPVAIQVGTAEKLLDDSVRLAERIRAASGHVELETFADLIHVFQAFAPHVPEGVEAIDKLGAFLRRTL